MHIPVLLTETINALNIIPDGHYIDATFGRGGHSRAILDQLGPKGKLLIIDKDEAALNHAREHFAGDQRLLCYHGSFADVEKACTQYQLPPVQGLLADLGMSSNQIEDPMRGFSFMLDGPLDMRMDQSRGISAQNFLAKVPKAELADIIYEYGQERRSRIIAEKITWSRQKEPITSTRQLAALVARVVPRSGKIHPATRTFQALRIYLNHEIDDLNSLLAALPKILAPGGKAAIISFHSLEDRPVKIAFRDNPDLEQIGKVIKPSKEECLANPRSSSSKLRLAKKLISS